jgi:hypothetical protein
VEPGFSFAGARIDIRWRLFARMARRTAFGENFLSARHDHFIRGDVSRPAGSVGEMVRF